MSESLPAFDAPHLKDWLDRHDAHDFDALPYGVVAMTAEGITVGYNTAESVASGLGPERVIGRHFFRDVAPCANNAIVAHRFDVEPELDAIIDYTFAFRLRPRDVRLRLLQGGRLPQRYLLIEAR